MYQNLTIKLLDYSVTFYLTSNYHKVGKSKIESKERSENWLATTLKSLWKLNSIETYSMKLWKYVVFRILCCSYVAYLLRN